MACTLCTEFRQRYPIQEDGKHHINAHFVMAAIRCAFEGSERFGENWNCETMIKLRGLTGEDYEEKQHPAFHYRDDMRCASIGVLAIPESDDENIQQGYLIMTWYKSRGETGQAIVMWDDNEPQLLTKQTAEFVINTL